MSNELESVETESVKFRTDGPIEEHLIVCSACRATFLNQEYILVGLRHFDTFMINQMKAYGLRDVNLEWEQGFLDNNRNFVDRKRALEIADASGQLKRRHLHWGLDSSDVW